MISVCMLGGAGGSTSGVARYYLAPDQGCGLAYYTEHEQVPGRWLGDRRRGAVADRPTRP